MPEQTPGSDIAEQLGIKLNMQGGIPTAGIMIVRTLHETNEVGITIGTCNTQSWVDNLGLVRAADIIMQNEMLLHTINADDD